MYQDGDLIIGGLFAFHLITVFPELNFKREPEQSHCERFYMASFQQAQTMVYAINEINNNPNLLPNITLGYQLYDNCVKLGLAFRSATALLSGTEETVSNFNCTGPPPVIGIVGDPGSTHCIAISSVLGLFRIPMVSYYATCSCLSDRKKYPSFFRTIPSDAFQCEEGSGPFSGNRCGDITNLKPWQLVHYLQKVNFTTGFGDHVSFDKNGDALAIYDVLNWQPSSDGSVVARTVGVVDEGAARGKVLTLEEDAIYWNIETSK
ncbi:hypothetical protein cypCar_00047428, partial [Cyprinus carpio]